MCNRSLLPLVFMVILAAIAGCKGDYKEPTIDEFNGRLTQSGEPIAFPDAKKVVLRLVFHKNGEHFGIPIQPDGTFDIGWMPIGNYSATLERTLKEAVGGNPVKRYEVPGGMSIAEGQTEYAIDLGEGYQP